MEPWEETALVGETLRLGGARLEILKMTDRCAATGVEPGAGRRDMDLVQTLRKISAISIAAFTRVSWRAADRAWRRGRLSVGSVPRGSSPGAGEPPLSFSRGSSPADAACAADARRG